jgi:hypothetical protein
MRNILGRRRGGGGSGPDFSNVDSQERAEELVSRGELGKLHLVPPEFGGSGDVHNLVYVPPFVVELKQNTDANMILPLIHDGRVRTYRATPRYEGPASSRAPSRSAPPIRVSSERCCGSWGTALTDAAR